MSARTSPWKHRKTATLFAEQNGRCWWCKCETVLMVGQPMKTVVRNRATIDHLRDRSNPGRQQPCEAGERRLVMACWQCNNDRGNATGNAINRASRKAAAADAGSAQA